MLLLLALLLVPAPVAAEKPWPDNPVGLCCSNSKLNCSCPKAPPVVWDACPKWHVGNNTIGTGVYDASGVLRQPPPRRQTQSGPLCRVWSPSLVACILLRANSAHRKQCRQRARQRRLLRGGCACYGM